MASAPSVSVQEFLDHYKKKLDIGIVNDQKVLEIFQRLKKVRVTKDLLERTLIAKGVKRIAKERGGEISERGLALVKQWKKVVESELSQKSSVRSSCDKRKNEQLSYKNEKNLISEYIPSPKKTKLSNIENSNEVVDIKHHNTSNGFSEIKTEKYLSQFTDLPIKEYYDPANPFIVKDYKPSPITSELSTTSQNFHSSHSSSDKKNKKINEHSIKTDKDHRNVNIHLHHFSSKSKTDVKPPKINVNKEKDASCTDYEHSIKTEKGHNNVKPSKINIKKEKDTSHADNEHSTRTEKGHNDVKPSKISVKKEKNTSHMDKEVKKSLNKEKKSHSTSKTVDKNIKKESNIKSTIKKKKVLKIAETEEFTSSQATFEDCLGFNDIMSPQKKKTVPKANSAVSKTTKVKSSHSDLPIKEKKIKPKESEHRSKPKEKLKSNHKEKRNSKESGVKLPKELQEKPKPIEIEEMKLLPEINPYYQPLPRFDFDSSYEKKKALSNEAAIMFTTSKKDRTAVYSGRRNHFVTEVSSLFELCLRNVAETITHRDYLEGVPYFLLKPVLERCSAMNLMRLEYHNPYLLEDSQELWEKHCARDFKNHQRLESETWREMYERIMEERERKLAKLTSNIKDSMSASNPVRRAKLAYIDSFVKPPRDVARKQAKFGTGTPVNHSVKPNSPSKTSPKSSTSFSVSVPERNIPVEKPVPVAAKKPSKPAPLMAKTLKAMKQVYRR